MPKILAFANRPYWYIFTPPLAIINFGSFAVFDKTVQNGLCASSILKLHARRRIGEISSGLETNERARTDLRPSGGKQSKSQTLTESGITTSTANRCEQMARIADYGGHAAALRGAGKEAAAGGW